MTKWVYLSTSRFALHIPWTITIRSLKWELKWHIDTHNAGTKAYCVKGLGWWNNRICFMGMERSSYCYSFYIWVLGIFVKNSFDSVLQCRVEAGDFLVSLLTLFFHLSLKKSPPRSQGLKAFSDPGSFSMLNLRKKHSFLTTSFHS